MNLPNYYDSWRTASESPRHMKYSVKCEDCDSGLPNGSVYYQIDGMKYCEMCMAVNYKCSMNYTTHCWNCDEEIPPYMLHYSIHNKRICLTCMDEMKSWVSD